jgi:hypothetical protein
MLRLADEIYDWVAGQPDVPSCKMIADLIAEKMRKGRSFYELEIAFRETADELRKLSRKFQTRAPWDAEAGQDASVASEQARLLDGIRFRTRIGV